MNLKALTKTARRTLSRNSSKILLGLDLNVTTLNYPRIIRKKGLTRLREGA